MDAFAGRDPRGHVVDQLLWRDLPGGDDVGLGELASSLVRDTDDGHVGHGGVAAQDGLEFGRGHLEAFDLDKFLDPFEQEQVAIGVEAGDVTREHDPSLAATASPAHREKPWILGLSAAE